MRFEEVHGNKQVLLLQCISGSKAYGLDTPTSDTDIKGVFTLPKIDFYGLTYTEQVNNPTNDIAYYEVKRFFELLLRNNPNILELLATPAQAVLYKNPLMDLVQPEMFLSKLCCQSFAGYAASQIKKAKGLNKKIHNPLPRERKSVPDFCYVNTGVAARPFADWLRLSGFEQQDCGLVSIPHFKETYGLYHKGQTSEITFNGIYTGDDANDVKLTPIPAGLQPLCLLTFHKDAYSRYCKDYKEYWDWVENRNEDRYNLNVGHGKNYDTKNMMHTFRLLRMANEIAMERKVNVLRTDREFLFRIRSGEFEYEELLEMSDSLLKEIEANYERSNLPDAPDEAKVNALLVKIRGALLSA